MRLTPGFKAHCLCVMIGSLVLCTNAAASSVEILVDAALDQKSLRTASEVALQVVRAAGNENSVGMVVYDEVFQRSTDLTVADETHVERISGLSASITPSEFSNIAVGIEKGISELNAEGGVLLVFGNNDILLADAEVVAKYRDWLQLILLPDAARKSIAIILAVPQNTKSSALDSIIQEYPNNRVISFRDTSDATEQLSALLPFRLPEVAGVAEVEVAEVDVTEVDVTDVTDVTALTPIDVLADRSPGDEPILSTELTQDQAVAESASPILKERIPQVADKAVAILPDPSVVASQDAQKDGIRFGLPILLAVITLLVFIAVAITLFMLKRRRDGKHELSDRSQGSAARPSPSRYLAPKQGVDMMLTTRAAETEARSTEVMPQTYESQGFSDSNLIDELNITESELDITAPRKPVKSDATTKVAGSDATGQRRDASSPDGAPISLKTGAVDELEELRNITKRRHHTSDEFS